MPYVTAVCTLELRLPVGPSELDGYDCLVRLERLRAMRRVVAAELVHSGGVWRVDPRVVGEQAVQEVQAA